MFAKMAPVPIISLTAPNNIRMTAKPTPIIKPSYMAGSTLFLQAKASARPRMTQLVVMSGRKMPSIWNSS